jgi:segregation and condensation protein A
MDTFRIELQIFRGPMDLLLHLVKRHELDVTDLPIAEITNQFLAHIEVLQELDIDSVGDFVEFASHLIEIKSRSVLPSDIEEQDEIETEHDELVRRLLEYKEYRDAASILEEQSRQWQQRQSRRADDLPQRCIDLETQPLQEVELWDLVSAFGRILKDNDRVKPASIVYDDTPIHVYMERICEQLEADQRVAFSQMFIPGMHKSAMIGVFLAMLELVRHHSVSTEQSENRGEIWITPGKHFGNTLGAATMDAYGELVGGTSVANAADDDSTTTALEDGLPSAIDDEGLTDRSAKTADEEFSDHG